jgi:hypothetical protein
MVDEPVSGGEGETVASLGLDISQYASALREALSQYEVFRTEFAKSLSIRLDATSLNAISNAFGVQMRQALQLLKGAQRETVAESAKTVKEIAAEYKKISGFEAFKELKKQARDAGREVTSEMGKTADAAKQMGDKIGDSIERGVKKGADHAERRIAELATTTRNAAEMADALSKDDRAKADRFTRNISKSLETYAQRLGGTADVRKRLEEISQFSPAPPPPIQKTDGTIAFDTKAAAQRMRDLRAAYREVETEIAAGGHIPRAGQFWESLAASVDKARRAFEALGPAGRKAHQEFLNTERARAMRERGFEESQIGAMRSGPYESYSDAEGFARALPKGENETQFIRKSRELEAMNAANRYAQGIEKELQQREAIEKRLTQQAARQLAAVSGRRALLPADRQAQLSPLPAPEAMITRGPDGKATGTDGQAFERLNSEVRTLAGNSKTTNEALNQYNQSLRGATRLTDGFNARLEKIGARSTQRYGPEDVITTDPARMAAPDRMVDINAKRAKAISQEVAQLEQQHAADRRRLRLTEAINAQLERQAARREELAKVGQLPADAKSLPSAGSLIRKGPDGSLSADRVAMDAIERETTGYEKGLQDRIAAEKTWYRKKQEERRLATAAEKKAIDEQTEYWRGHYRTLRQLQKDQATGAREHAKLLTARESASVRADQQAVGVTGRLADISKQTGLQFGPVSGSQFLTKDGLFDQDAQRRADTLIKAAEQELKEYNAWLDRRNKVIKENAANEQRINDLAKRNLARKGANQAAIEASSQKELERTRQAVPAMPAVGPATTRLAQAHGVPMGPGVAFAPPAPPAAAPRVDAAALQQAYKGVNVEAKAVEKTTGAIGLNLAQQATNMVKWLFFYKAVHEVTRAIQTTIRTFVRLGVEYNKNLEQHQLALRGILSENYNLTDAHGQQISGMVALSALQITARNQWREIQQAALSVVGTTSDLMGLYAGIMPFSAKLGADLGRVVDLTKAAAVAGSLLDISFQDIRSALISLLQGRALVRNRLVGAMGFTREEVRELKGTPQLLELVEGRIRSFLLLADEASQTFAAVKEQIQDFIGIMAGGFTQPMVDLFKEFVLALTETNGQFAIFEKTTSGIGLRILPELQAFIDFTKAAFGQLAREMKGFGADFAIDNRGEMQQWVIGLREMTSVVVGMFAMIAKGGAVLATFIAQNRELIKWLAWAALATSAYEATKKLVSAIAGSSYTYGLFAKMIAFATGNLGEHTDALNGTTRAITRTEVAAAKWKTIKAGLGAAFAVTGAIYAISTIMTRLAQMKQIAQSTREAMEAIGKGDIDGAVVALQDRLTLGSSGERVDAAFTMIGLADEIKGGILAIFGDDLSDVNIGSVARSLADQLQKLDEEIQGLTEEFGRKQVEMDRIMRATVGRKTADPREIELLNKISEIDERIEVGSPLFTLRNELSKEIKAINEKLGELRSGLTGAGDAHAEAAANLRDITAIQAQVEAGLKTEQRGAGRAGDIRRLSADYDSIIERESAKHGIDPDLIRALIYQESSFNRLATSPKGAMGLMQLMPGTAQEMGVADAFDAAQNIAGGVAYLAKQIEKFGTTVGLAAYNAGPGAVQRYGGTVPPFRETRDYVDIVEASARALRGESRIADLQRERAGLQREIESLERRVAATATVATAAQQADNARQIEALEKQLESKERQLALWNDQVLAGFQERGMGELRELEAEKAQAEAELAELRQAAAQTIDETRAKQAKEEEAAMLSHLFRIRDRIELVKENRRELIETIDSFPRLVQQLGLIVGQERVVKEALDRLVSPGILGVAGALTADALRNPAGAARAAWTVPLATRVERAGDRSPEEIASIIMEDMIKTGFGSGRTDPMPMRRGMTDLLVKAIQGMQEANQAVTLTAVASAIEGEFKDKRALLDELQPKVYKYNIAREPLLTPKDIEKAFDPERPKYVSTAPDRTRSMEAVHSVEKARLETLVAQEVMTRAQADAHLEELDVERLEARREFIKDDLAMWERYVEAREDLFQSEKGERVPLEEQLKQGFEFDRLFTEVDAELIVAQERREAAQVRRLREFTDEIKDASLQLSKATGDMFGIAEESAMASWDRTTEGIRKKLTALAAGFDQLAEVDRVMDARAAQRPKAAVVAGARDQISGADKTMSAAREQQGLLLQSLHAGEASASAYLTRIQEIRDVQRDSLMLMISGRETLAAMLQQELDSGMIDPGLVSAYKIELMQVTNQLAAARQELAHIDSMAARVELALQGWSNLTQQVSTFLSVANFDGTNTGLELMIKHLGTAMTFLDGIIKSAHAFSKIGDSLNSFKGLFGDVGGFGGIGKSFGALGSLITGGLFDRGPKRTVTTSPPVWDIDEAGHVLGFTPAKVTESIEAVKTSAQKFMSALPAIGVGISAALSIATMLFNQGVERAKKDISESFKKISKALADETATLGQTIGEAEKERQRIIARYSKSKSGRKALKELLPDIDAQIEAMKRQAAQAKKSFDEAFALAFTKDGGVMRPGPTQDFARELMNLEKFIREYLDSINITTTQGLAEMARALERVGLYVNAFFENAKIQFGEALLGFESEALASQERLFSLYNNRDGLYKQLRDIGEARQDLEEAIADEMERREEAQSKINDLAKKEAEIRKRIADIIRQAAEDEMAIRRRGVLEAQLSVAHQKAIDISNVRYKAQEEIERLKKELAELQNKIDDETKANARKDRDFDRQRRNLDEREADVRKELRLNDIRIDGARRVADIQGEIFGMAEDEFDLAVRQNDLGVRQAEIQVAKWRETKALFDAIVRGADGFLFDPPDYFPQIKVDLGSIIIDNRDQSTNTFPGTGTTGPGSRPNPGVPSTGTAVPRSSFDDGSAEIDDIYDDARRQGFGDV